MVSFTRTVADLQQLTELDPISMFEEFGLSKCTKTCRDSCGFTCGAASCTHTVGVVAAPQSLAEGGGVSDEAVRKAQAEGGRWD
jgi:hypothetical protein